MNYDESIRDHLAEVERTLDDVRNTLDTPYLKVDWHYLPITGSIRYTVLDDTISVFHGNQLFTSFSGETAIKLINWLYAHSVDIEEQS